MQFLKIKSKSLPFISIYKCIILDFILKWHGRTYLLPQYFLPNNVRAIPEN